MRVEKISDNQIKFFFTENDLIERNTSIHELSYGSDKAQSLFKEILERANIDYDFQVNYEAPLVIETVPMSRDGLMIIVTKITGQSSMESSLGHLPFFSKNKNLQKPVPSNSGTKANEAQNKNSIGYFRDCVYEFESLDNVASACGRAFNSYIGRNSLFKYLKKYYLVIDNESPGLELNVMKEVVLLEYGSRIYNRNFTKQFLFEHGEIILAENAINALISHLQ